MSLEYSKIFNKEINGLFEEKKEIILDNDCLSIIYEMELKLRVEDLNKEFLKRVKNTQGLCNDTHSYFYNLKDEKKDIYTKYASIENIQGYHDVLYINKVDEHRNISYFYRDGEILEVLYDGPNNEIDYNNIED
jgi:hypothetical protein